MINHKILFIFLAIFLTTAKAQPLQETNVITITFVGNADKAAAKLKKIITEQAENGWFYDSYIDLKDTQFDSKLLIFKK
ncbi:hypothetical protein DS885_03925 [Psychromonas sp. B3M02]|uniref:hypothetical protein n=1 Tax=Psychromonas sp. B3M02 TaxID=2267226 RepID=UPI000DEB6948|nr:hypothetical protein [Psychromonas sp. B3M02]RBW47305.1 hypothetical protein DS885_03925 [Psychromonas sp. B3M02]